MVTYYLFLLKDKNNSTNIFTGAALHRLAIQPHQPNYPPTHLYSFLLKFFLLLNLLLLNLVQFKISLIVNSIEHCTFKEFDMTLVNPKEVQQPLYKLAKLIFGQFYASTNLQE